MKLIYNCIMDLNGRVPLSLMTGASTTACKKIGVPYISCSLSHLNRQWTWCFEIISYITSWQRSSVDSWFFFKFEEKVIWKCYLFIKIKKYFTQFKKEIKLFWKHFNETFYTYIIIQNLFNKTILTNDC